MRCREFGRRRRLPRSKIADAPRREPVPHQKKFKKTKSCWGPLFIILIKRAGAGRPLLIISLLNAGVGIATQLLSLGQHYDRTRV